MSDDHELGLAGVIEKPAGVGRQQARREWAPQLTPLDIAVDPIADANTARVRQDAALTKARGPASARP